MRYGERIAREQQRALGLPASIQEAPSRSVRRSRQGA